MKYSVVILVLLTSCGPSFEEECSKKKCPAPFIPYMFTDDDFIRHCLCQVIPK